MVGSSVAGGTSVGIGVIVGVIVGDRYGVRVGLGTAVAVDDGGGTEVAVRVGVEVNRSVGRGVLVLVLVKMMVGVRVMVGVKVSVGEGVLVQVAVSVRTGIRVIAGSGVLDGSPGTGVLVAVLVLIGAMISPGRVTRLPGADQIAGPLTWASGAGRKPSFCIGAAKMKGKTRNKQIPASPCARVTPSNERVFATTILKRVPTRNTKIKSSHDL